jgi:ParB family chromosome partitioning protein
MIKKALRTTISQMDNSSPLQGQPARDHAAMILPVSAIKLGENIRKELGNLEELAASITAHGILQPLVIAKTVHGLELVAGHRRLEAAKLAGLTEVPVRIVGADENLIAVLRLVENLIRDNLSGADEVTAVAKLAAMFHDQVQLAKAIGKSKSYVSRCLKSAALVESDRVATSQLSKSALFEIADKADPVKALNEIAKAEKQTVQAARQDEGRRPSGPSPGGRYVEGALQFRENERTRAFSLRINFDPDRTPADTKAAVVKKLEEILKRLGPS